MLNYIISFFTAIPRGVIWTFKKTKESITLADFYKLSWNLIIFVTFQTIFFHVISSQFTLDMISKKTTDLSRFVTYQMSPAQLSDLKSDLEQRKALIEQTALAIAKERYIENVKFLLQKTSYWLITATAIFLGTLMKAWLSNSIKFEDILIMIVIILSYGTEAIMYFGMFQRHNYIGTYEIIKSINTKLPESPQISQEYVQTLRQQLQQKL